MSDNYHYEDGAKHYDHKKVLHIDSVGSGDIEKLISAFFKDGAEDAEVLEELKDAESIQCKNKELINIPHQANPVVEAIKEQTELLKKIAEQPRTQNNYTLELVQKKEMNIDKNYGPNIENNGALSLPEGLGTPALQESEDDK